MNDSLEALRQKASDLSKPLNRPEQFPEKPVPNQPKMGQKCLFCEIVAGTMPTYQITANDDYIAFLDIQPKAIGHTVVIPKHHAKGLEEMASTEAATYIDFVGMISELLKQRLGATGFTLMSPNGVSSGQFVEHFATHIIPTYAKEGIELATLSALQTQRIPDSIMKDVQAKLK